MAKVNTSVNPWGLLIAALLGALFAFAPVVDASFLPLPENDALNVAKPQGDTAVERAESFLGPLARAVRMIMAGVAVLFITVSGLAMVIRGESEEVAKNERTAMTYAVIGLLMLSAAGPVATIFDFRAGNFLADPESLTQKAALFDQTTRVGITFIKYFLGSLATAYMIRSGFLMVTSLGNEETVTREKKNLALGVGGLLMIMASELVIRKILFTTSYSAEQGTIVALDSNELVRQLVAVTNIMVTFLGPILMLLFVVGGIMYITAGGEEERTNTAKNIMVNSVIGIIVVYGAFALVSTVISGVF